MSTARKASVGLFGLVLIGGVVISVVWLFYGFPMFERFLAVRRDAEVFVKMNDEAGKVFPILSARAGGVSNAEFFACMISGSSECGDMDGGISHIAEEFDTSVILYDSRGVLGTYGDKKEGDVIMVEIPLPGGKTGTVGFMLDIPSVSPMVTDWVWPLDTGSGLLVSHCYGEKRVSKKTGRHYIHSGIDLGGSAGDEIYAVAGGTVKYVCSGAVVGDTDGCHGYGNMLVVRHGSYYVRYSHLSRLADGMKENAVVKKGDVIGYMGNTGYSFGDHLDFKVYSFDPGQWGYNADIDPLCMYAESYLSGTVKLSRAEGDDDCQKARSVCSAISKGGHGLSDEEED